MLEVDLEHDADGGGVGVGGSNVVGSSTGASDPPTVAWSWSWGLLVIILQIIMRSISGKRRDAVRQ